MLSVHQFVPFIALTLNVLLVVSALVTDRRSQRNFIFAWLGLGLSIWNLGVFGLRSTTDPAVAMQWERVVHVGVIPVPVLFFHYVLVFLDLSRRSRALVAGYVLAAAFVLVSPTSWFLRGVTPSAWGFMPASGPLYAPFFLYFYVYLVLGLVLLTRAYGATTSAFRRNRIRFVILGTSLTVAGGAVDFLRFILGWEWMYPVGIPSNAAFTIALGIAIVRYRLWDLSHVAKRIVLYVLVSLGVVPVVALSTLYVIDWAVPHDQWSPNLPVLFALLVVVAALLPFLRRIEVAFERFMFASRHGVREALTALSRDMASILDLERLGARLTGGLVADVPVLHARLYLHEPASSDFRSFSHAESPAFDGGALDAVLEPRLVLWLKLTGRPLTVEDLAYHGGQDPAIGRVLTRLEAARTALLVPLMLDGELAAILVVGEKVAGAVFDSADIEQLDMLMAQAGIALKNARLYRDLILQMEQLRATQQQLVQAAKLAAIGELAASVAHELNNPLTVIVGRSESLVYKSAPGSPAAAIGETIKTEALRASRITRGLLDFARRREPKREPVSPTAILTRALDLVGGKLRGRGIVVDGALSDVPPLLGDADQLLQVFINLLGNAIDAMPGGGRLGLSTVIADTGATIRVSVSDTGVGMTTEQMARMFEPFYTTKPEGQGTGLGLPVTLGIVTNHGGTIMVESELGVGTTMIVELPLTPVGDAVGYGVAR